MIIVRDVFREIICNAEHFYINTYSNRIMLVHDIHNGIGLVSNEEPITQDFELKRKGVKTMDWIFEQMKSQRGNPNIIIDMKECPYLKEVKDEE